FWDGGLRHQVQPDEHPQEPVGRARRLRRPLGRPVRPTGFPRLGVAFRCSRRQRDFEAAREDIERALELAERLDDTLTVAHITFQASLIAERDGQWLRARTLAERAKELYETHGDRQNLGRMLNNLGGLNFLLGKSDDAISYLKRAFSVALEVGSDADAAQAVSSL